MSKRLMSAIGSNALRLGCVPATLASGVGQRRGKPLNVAAPLTRKSSQCGDAESAIPGLGFCVSNICRMSFSGVVPLSATIQFITLMKGKPSRIVTSVTAKERLASSCEAMVGGSVARRRVAATLNSAIVAARSAMTFLFMILSSVRMLGRFADLQELLEDAHAVGDEDFFQRRRDCPVGGLAFVARRRDEGADLMRVERAGENQAAADVLRHEVAAVARLGLRARDDVLGRELAADGGQLGLDLGAEGLAGVAALRPPERRQVVECKIVVDGIALDDEELRIDRHPETIQVAGRERRDLIDEVVAKRARHRRVIGGVEHRSEER